MKIVAFNGSHKGKNENTDITLEAFPRGAKNAGAETQNILLTKKILNTVWRVNRVGLKLRAYAFLMIM